MEIINTNQIESFQEDKLKLGGKVLQTVADIMMARGEDDFSAKVKFVFIEAD